MSAKFDEMIRERDALYQATLPANRVPGPIAFDFVAMQFYDRYAKQRDAIGARLARLPDEYPVDTPPNS